MCTPGEVEICAPMWLLEKDGVGPCRAPRRTCTVKGSWSSCIGEVPPALDEKAGDAIDDDCDGTALTGSSIVARYFINEDPSPNPVEIHDAVDPALTLHITNSDPPTLSIAEDADQHRGLLWKESDTTARASVQLDATKVKSMLQGATGATLEAVVELNTIVDHTRIIYIGHVVVDGNGDTDGRDNLSMYLEGGRIQLRMDDDQIRGEWAIDPTNYGRLVLQISLDTTGATPVERRSLYVNGTLIPSVDDNEAPAQSTIDLTPSTDLALGTRPSGPFSPQGMIHYAAIYARALSKHELQTNAALLLLDDDHP